MLPIPLGFIKRLRSILNVDTKSVFEFNLNCLDADFCIFKISCQIKSKEPSLPLYLPIVKREITDRFIPLHLHKAKFKQLR